MVGVEEKPGGAKHSEIRFYRYREGLKRVDHLTVVRNSNNLGKAGSVGITNYKSPEGERYLLATCPDDRRVHFYRTEPGVPLSDTRCKFGAQPIIRWGANSVPMKDRTQWKPDQSWGSYVNNIALLADKSGQVYFLGMYRKRGKHYADLFAVNVDTDTPKTAVLTKVSRVSVDADDGTGFRWGAGALVVSPTKLRLFACERDVPIIARRIRLNIFHGKNDPL